MSHSLLPVAPPNSIGWTHVWGGQREVVPLSDEQAHTLAFVGLIEWSGIYKVYRPCEGVSLETVKKALGR